MPGNKGKEGKGRVSELGERTPVHKAPEGGSTKEE